MERHTEAILENDNASGVENEQQQSRYPSRMRTKSTLLANFDVNEEDFENEEVSSDNDTTGKPSKKSRWKKCQICRESFSSGKELKEHWNQHNKKVQDSTLVCKTCFKSFRSKDCVRRHERLHLGQKPFCCELCNQGFSNAHALSEHNLKHLNERPHDCPKCGLKFRHLSSLKRHASVHGQNANKFQCEICSKTFSQGEYLKKHMLVHTKVRRFLCTQCPKRFLHSSDMIRHRRVHAGERPYECPVCSMRFLDVSSRRRHLREHQHQPLGCPQCNRTFKKESLLMVHLVKDHGSTAGKNSAKTASPQKASQTCKGNEQVKVTETVNNESHLETLEAIMNTTPEMGTLEQNNMAVQVMKEQVGPAISNVNDSYQEQSIQDQGIEMTASEFANSLSVIDFVTNPDFSNQEFYDWLSQFVASSKMLTLPIVPEVFSRISQVQKTLMDNLAFLDGVLANKENFRILLNITADLQKVLNSHLMFVYDLLPS